MSADTSFRPSSGLSQRSAKASLITVCVALLFATVLLIFFQLLSLRTAMVEDLTVQSKIVASNTVAAIVFRDRSACEETLNSLDASLIVKAAAVFDADNSLLAHYARQSQELVSAPSPQLLADGHAFDLRDLEVAQPVLAEGNIVGYVVLRADLEPMYNRLRTSALITFSIVLGSLGFAYLLVTRMRRRLARAEERLTYLAHVDPVTGLPNRHAFNERLAFAVHKLGRFGGSVDLLLLDLDNFKFVNDTLGHDSGDVLLKQVALRMTAALREADLICRIGGDEFAIVLESSSGTGQGSEVATKLIAALSTPFQIGSREIYATGSIGVSRCPDDGPDLLSLTRNADTAMYHAKALGKNTFTLFTRDLDQPKQKRLSLETRLRKALERDELMLYYQPKMNLADDTIIGFEALLRWRDPELGMISPADFIPVAEQTGLMAPIGRWVLKTAIRAIATWRDLGIGDIHVAVNMSVQQTKDTGLLAEILTALKAYSVRPEQLTLEITESVLMEHVESNIEFLAQLRACGIKLSLDDFGTGYSSMAYLKRFDIDELKIDQTFIRDIPGDNEDQAILTAIIAMSHSLGLSTVAEGVETSEQLAFLRAVQCDSAQGYYLAKPMPFAEVPVFLKRREPAETLP